MGGHTYEKSRTDEIVEQLKSHPNYSKKVPLKGETKIQFTLRCIAHLVSPPMEIGETNEIECTDLANAILAMEKEITEIWDWHKTNQP